VSNFKLFRAKETINKVKQQSTKWNKVFANHTIQLKNRRRTLIGIPPPQKDTKMAINI
jgi:hypothetical protein